MKSVRVKAGGREDLRQVEEWKVIEGDEIWGLKRQEKRKVRKEGKRGKIEIKKRE